MPQVIQASSVCYSCQRRFKWHQSKSGKCYWCETGREERKSTLVEPPVASFKPSKAKRR